MIYLVSGSTDCYEDERRWPVMTFLAEKDAQDFRNRCQKIYDEASPPDVAFRERERRDMCVNWPNARVGVPEGWKHPLDPEFQEQKLTSVEYSIEELPGPL